MKDGTLTAAPETPPSACVPDLATDEAVGLCADVHCILIECHRDRALAALRLDAPAADIAALAQAVARRLGPRVGGRYVPKRGDSDQKRIRDEAVWQAILSGRNVQKIIKDFDISSRLYYTIKARMPKEKRGRR